MGEAWPGPVGAPPTRGLGLEPAVALTFVLAGGCCAGVIYPSFPGPGFDRYAGAVGIAGLSAAFGFVYALRLWTRGQRAYAGAFVLVAAMCLLCAGAGALDAGAG